ncbi:MAG: hypothetical protein H6729_02385 [Deltaproteobacteria bacterium]|nr:hypothetical protein [Deltaproteobacteria bacterium]
MKWVPKHPSMLSYACVVTSLASFAFSAACESVDTGHLEDPSTPPKLVRLLIQDEQPFGRFSATDILRDADPEAANNVCSERNPCAAELGQFCNIAPGSTTGFCIDPLNPRITPPAIGIPMVYGGNQIRLVFDQGLASTLDAQLQMEDDTTVMLTRDGAPIAAVKYVDNSGSPAYSAFPTLEPFGPAIVLKPLEPLVPSVMYAITFDAEKVIDRDGQSLAASDSGPYNFTMEGFYPFGVVPDVLSSTTTVIAPNSVVQFSLNAAVDEMTLPFGTTATVTATSLRSIKVTNESGESVLVRGWIDRGMDPSACAPNGRTFNVIRSTSAGVAQDWAPGVYTMSFESVEAADSDTMLGSDAFGSPLSVTFSVGTDRADPGEDPMAIENMVLPENCP